MASEDSDEFLPGLPPIHRLRDLGDLDQAACRQMPTSEHELHAVRELLEVLLLGSSHRMRPEERNDRLQKIRPASHDVPVHVLAVVVMPLIAQDLSDAEELTKLVEGTQRLKRLA